MHGSPLQQLGLASVLVRGVDLVLQLVPQHIALVDVSLLAAPAHKHTRDMESRRMTGDA
jgi:hypothetical protein